MAKIKFTEIEVGQGIMFNGHYAVKKNKTEIYIPRLGVDGIFYIGEDHELELCEDDDGKP